MMNPEPDERPVAPTDQAAEKDSVYLESIEKIGDSSKNILVFENVLSEEEHSMLLDFCSKADFSSHIQDPEDQWYKRVVGNLQMTKEVREALLKVFNFAKTKIDSEYRVDVDFLSLSKLSIVLWNTGDQMGKHVDDWAIHHYNIATIFYINSDYSGGEISFPDHNITIKPNSNSLIMFPGNSSYLHEVLEIKSGNRYTSNMWFKFSGSKFEGSIV